jgi:hypothetical protein
MGNISFGARVRNVPCIPLHWYLHAVLHTITELVCLAAAIQDLESFLHHRVQYIDILH